MKTQRFVLACDLKIGDSVLIEGRPYLVTKVEQRATEVTASSGTWSITLTPDEAVEMHRI